MHEGSRTAVIAALLANIGIALSKFVGFFITGAASLLAEGVHSLVDTANQGLLLLGGHRSKQEAVARAPLRLRAGALLLGLRRRPRAVPARRRCSPSTRASRSSATPTIRSSWPSPSGSSCSRWSWRRCRCAPPCGRRATTRRGRVVVGLHPPIEGTRAPGRAARGHGRRDRSGPGPDRGGDGQGHRRAEVGRGRAASASGSSWW